MDKPQTVIKKYLSLIKGREVITMILLVQNKHSFVFFAEFIQVSHFRIPLLLKAELKVANTNCTFKSKWNERCIMETLFC